MSRLVNFGACIATTLLLAHCAAEKNPGDDDDGGAAASGGTSSAGTTGKGGTSSTAGTSPTGGANPSGGTSPTAGTSPTGGANPTGGTSSAGTAGASGSSGGSVAAGTGGVSAGGSAGATAGNAGTTAGTNSTGGAGASGGGAGATGGGGSGPDVDQNGKTNATPGTMTSTAQDYLRLGDVRIINNNWGSEDLNCGNASSMSVFVNQDRTFGWNFNRGNCDTAATNAKPDFPQLEFGIHPFGIGDDRATSPNFSSTTLLPIQIKNVTSATINIQNMNANFQQEGSWNITFEFWISQRDPVNDPDPGVYAELMTFWGWQNGRWPSPPNGTGPTGNGAGNQVQSGGRSYTLWVQDDQWADGQWRYFQFRVDDGPQRNFNGTLDVKPFIDYLVNSRQYSPEFWISRLEIGSEIDDLTQGTVQMSGITFEINGQSRPAVIGGN